MAFLPEGVATKYRGYILIVCCEDIMCVAPNGDIACFYSPARARLWVRRHKASSQARERGGVIRSTTRSVAQPEVLV